MTRKSPEVALMYIKNSYKLIAQAGFPCGNGCIKIQPRTKKGCEFQNNAKDWKMPYRMEQAGFVMKVQQTAPRRQNAAALARLMRNFEEMRPEWAQMLLDTSDVYAERYPQPMTDRLYR